MPIYSFEGKSPQIAVSAYIAPSAVVIGRVKLGERCYVGPGAILRGDYGAIEIGDETAVEEGVIVHARPEDWTRIGSRVTLGHGAMVHNATIQDGAVIGMRAVVSDFSEVGAGAIVGEMGLVRQGQKVPPGSVALGVPVKIVGDVSDRHQDMAHWAKELYVDLAHRYRDGALVELDGGESTTATTIEPIGTIHTPFGDAPGTPVQGALSKGVQGEVRIRPDLEEGLRDLDGFSHIVLIYTFHKTVGYNLTVTPYLDPAPHGMFATRVPRRPNSIGLTVVRLDKVDGTTLQVTGVDMLDETPLLDIKPYVPIFDAPQEVRCGWLEPHLETLLRGETVPKADDRFHGVVDEDSEG